MSSTPIQSPRIANWVKYNSRGGAWRLELRADLRPASTRRMVSACALAIISCSGAARNPDHPTLDSHITVLPTGKLLDPAGRTIDVGNMPLSIAVAPDGRHAFVLLSGWRQQGLQMVDLATGGVIQTLPQKSAFFGLAITPDGRSIYTSGATQNAIYRYDRRDGRIGAQTTLALGPPDSLLEHARIAAGIALSRDSRFVYVAENMVDSLSVVDAATGRVGQHLRTSHYPYAIVVDQSGRLYVSAWGASVVDVFEPTGSRLARRASIDVGRHPSGLCLSPNGDRLFVALSGTDEIAIVDTKAGKVISTLSDAAADSPREGSTPNALVVSRDGSRLFVAEADNNAVAVFDLSTSDAGIHTSNAITTLAGRMPVLWYPTALALLGDSLLVVSGKGRGTRANPAAPKDGSVDPDPRTYTLGQLDGTISILDAAPSPTVLAQLSTRVARANGWDAPRSIPAHPPIEHAILIIKENRTYDQVLSDLPSGDGDTSLIFFPRSVSPNHHALAERFGLYDRFFTNAEVSSQGHPWSVSAYVTEYTEKTVPSLYSDRRAEVNEGDVDEPSTGFLWTAAARKGLEVRDYGEYAEPNPDSLKSSGDGEKRPYRAVRPSLTPFVNPDYPSFNMAIPDQRRADVWIDEFHRFVRAGKMPELEILHLPADHTAGARPGRCTPRACMADNDLALGRIVEALSRSPFWKNTAVFVVEDDSQAGPDHIDSHRSVLLVISPYSRRGTIHRFVNTTDVLATIEEILGIPPLSQFDRFGRPLHNVWNATADLTPYTASVPQQSITETNPPRGVGAAESMRLNLSAADRIDDARFNRLLWRVIKGNRPFPAPPRSSTLDYVRDR